MKKGRLFPTEKCTSSTAVESTSEFRCPRRGEYFISGAIPTGYLAPNDLNAAYHIGRLVQVETSNLKRVVKYL